MARLNLSAKAVLGKNFNTPAKVPVLLVSVTDENGFGVVNLRENSFEVRRLEHVQGYLLPILDIVRFKEQYYDYDGSNTTDGLYLMELYPPIVPDVDDTIPVGTILAIRVQQFGLAKRRNELVGEPPINVRGVISQGWTTTIVQGTDSNF